MIYAWRPDVMRCMAQLAELELRQTWRLADNARHASNANWRVMRGEIPTATEMGALWWSWFEARMVPIAAWAKQGGRA